MASVAKREWTSPEGEKKIAWVVRYTDEAGKRRLVTKATKKAADAERLRIETELSAGVHTAKAKSVSIKELASEFERYTEERHRAGMIGQGYLANVAAGLRLSIVPQLGAIAIADLTVDSIERFFRHLTQDQKLAARTAMERKRLLAALEGWAIRRGYTQRRIVDEVAKGFPFGQTKKVLVPTKEQVKSLLRVSGERDAWGRRRTALFRKLYVHLATFCGLRFGEIGGLRVCDVDLAKGVLRVRQNVTKWREVKGPKTSAGVRDVPLPRHLIEDLDMWLKWYLVPNADDLVLVTPAGQTVRGPDWHRHHWKDLLRRAGLEVRSGRPRIHFHALRHFAGSWWLENEMDITLVSKLMGHANPATTMGIYAHTLRTIAEAQQRIMSASSALLDA
jgi:integrase